MGKKKRYLLNIEKFGKKLKQKFEVLKEIKEKVEEAEIPVVVKYIKEEVEPAVSNEAKENSQSKEEPVVSDESL